MFTLSPCVVENDQIKHCLSSDTENFGNFFRIMKFFLKKKKKKNFVFSLFFKKNDLDYTKMHSITEKQSFLRLDIIPLGSQT